MTEFDLDPMGANSEVSVSMGDVHITVMGGPDDDLDEVKRAFYEVMMVATETYIEHKDGEVRF